MSLNKIKNLIGEGKTQEAIDALQKLLADIDTPLLNQTYLLENQFKDVQKKMQLGLQDASTDINRINYTLLSICDEAEKIEELSKTTRLDLNTASKESFGEVRALTNLSNRTLIIFGVIVAIVTALIFSLIALSSSDTEKQSPTETTLLPTQTPELIPAKPTEPSIVEWRSTPPSMTTKERYWGEVKVDIIESKATIKDADKKTLTLQLRLNCQKASSGKCLINYLQYRLVTPEGLAIVPLEDLSVVDMPKTNTAVETRLRFDIPKTISQSELEVYFKGKKEQTLSKLKLEVSR